MANTTFSGPVTSSNGFISGPNVNAGDTPYTVVDTSNITDGTNTLDAADNEGVLVYVQDGAAGAAVYAFSDGTNWKRVDTLANIDNGT